MTFNPDIPQSTDDISQSQGEILINFQEINTRLQNDHIAITNATPADRIKHKQVTFHENQTDPNLSYPESMAYTKSYGLTPNRNQIAYIDLAHEDGTDQIVPIHPLAFVKFSAAPLISKQFNVSSVVRLGAGNFRVTFNKNLPDANYIPIVTIRRAVSDLLISVINNSDANFDIQLRTTDGTLTDPSDVYCVVWGF